MEYRYQPGATFCAPTSKRNGIRTLLVIGLVSASAAMAQQKIDNNTIFQLDGNAKQSVGTGTGEDWDTYFCPPSGTVPCTPSPANFGSGNAVAKNFITDVSGKSIFTGGGSKDILGISNWKFTDGSVPDKDDILHAYAAAYNVSSNLLVYFGADRFANNGDANIGFWFFQNAVSPNPATGTFTGVHKDGDIFVESSFTSGGQVSSIAVSRWSGDDITGSLVPLTGFVTGECASSGTGTNDACAIANKAVADSPWFYNPKSGPNNKFPIASFFEGGLNINTLISSGTGTCFATFLVETRSSSSADAVLKDFVSGSFESCGVSISKTCTNGRLNATGTGFLYDVLGTVTNTGTGTISNVVVTDNMPGATAQTFNVGSVTGGATVCWPNANCTTPATFDTGTTNGPINTAHVTADTGGTTVTGDTDAACPSVATNPSLTVSKSCTTDLAVSGNVLAVAVTYAGQVCNSGNVPLNNVSVVDNVDSHTFTIGTIAPATASGPTCVNYGPQTYLPSVATSKVTLGRYSFADTVTATGTPSIGTCGGSASCSQNQTATCFLCENGQCHQ
jgi:hypothetical protein